MSQRRKYTPTAGYTYLPMATIIYKCDHCSGMYVLSSGSLASIPFNRLPQLVLKADGHKCIKKVAA